MVGMMIKINKRPLPCKFGKSNNITHLRELLKTNMWNNNQSCKKKLIAKQKCIVESFNIYYRAECLIMHNAQFCLHNYY